MSGYDSKRAAAANKVLDLDGHVVGKVQKPKRPWVGLTDKERQDIALEVPMDAVFITEAKLKEKNT